MQRYKPNTVAAARCPLAAAPTWAVRQLIAVSPMATLRLPRKTALSDRLSTDEAQRLLQAAQRQEPARHVAVSLALRLGLRFGEVWGLRWRDIDLPRRRLTVARSFDRAPKSGKPRTLPIPDGFAPGLGGVAARVSCNAEGRVCPSARRPRPGSPTFTPRSASPCRHVHGTPYATALPPSSSKRAAASVLEGTSAISHST